MSATDFGKRRPALPPELSVEALLKRPPPLDDLNPEEVPPPPPRTGRTLKDLRLGRLNDALRKAGLL